MFKNTVAVTAFALVMALAQAACEDAHPSADQVQASRQEQVQKEGVAQVGIPSIKNHREMKILKDIYELRDQMNLVTYTYLFSEVTGKLTFFCDSLGYGFPYATQFTAPTKLMWVANHGYIQVPQAEPNGLFPPSSAEGTWVMCLNPKSHEAEPQYVEPKITVMTYKIAQ